jgi:hypothetical protein
MSYLDVDYGFDGTFRSICARGSRRVTQGLAVDFQLNASLNCSIEPDFIAYDLDVKNYNDLIERKLSNSGIPCVVLLKILPTNHHFPRTTISLKQAFAKSFPERRKQLSWLIIRSAKTHIAAFTGLGSL